MKAYLLKKYWKNSTLELAEMPQPKPNDNEVLVQIMATSINPLDSKIKKGDLKPILRYKTPLILGHDVAGIVTEVGKNIKNFQVWDEIFARIPDFHIGSFAEFVTISEEFVAHKPKNLTFEESASIPLVGLTAWQIFEKANLKSWQKIFIQAGSGWVGSIAIQLAKHLWAFVATTTSEKNFDFVKNLWADKIIDYRKENFEEILSDYDLVLHNQNMENLEKSFKILKKWWKIISISEPPTADFAREFWLPWYIVFVMKILSQKAKKLTKQHNVHYEFLFMKANGKQLQEIGKLLEKEIIKPNIDKIFDFSQLNEAMQYSESGRAKWKIVVKIF